MPRRAPEAGFTLLEILIVVGLMAVFMGVFLPRFGNLLGIQLKDSARQISAELETTSQSAVATGRIHRWVVDLDQQMFRMEFLERVDEDPIGVELPTHSELLSLAPPAMSTEYTPVGNNNGSWRSLETDRVFIDEIRIEGEDLRDGVVAIPFAPDGGTEPAEIWLIDEEGFEMRLRLIAFTGEVRIEEAAR